MTFFDLLSTHEDRAVSDVEILNELRRNDKLVLGTSDLAEAIGMSRQGAQNRLDELEEDERVISQRVGRYLVWGLHPSERREPVTPEIDRLVHTFDRFREAMMPTKFIGGAILALGLGVIYLGLTGIYFSAKIPGVPTGVIPAIGWIAAGVGAGTWLVGGGAIYSTYVIERVAERRVKRARRIKATNHSERSSEQRGQVDPRFIFGIFVLILFSGVLVEFGSNMYTTLADAPLFSPLQALVLAILFVLIIVFAILGA